MKKIVLIILFLTLSACTKKAIAPQLQTITINQQSINIELAVSKNEQSAGLSNRDSLPKLNGMLFLFKEYGQYNFWMKDMRFSIDIIWIKDNTIVDITKNIPYDNLRYYQSSIPINYVLELNAGFTDEYNIKIGDRVDNLPNLTK